MRQDLIFFPAVTLVLLTALVWVLLYRRRTGALRARRLSPEAFKTRASRVSMEEAASVSDNFQNLLELPVLFYALVLTLFVTTRVDAVYLGLMWSFVATRVVHTFVHVTYNLVLHRFIAYLIGGLLLWAGWLRFAWQLLRG